MKRELKAEKAAAGPAAAKARGKTGAKPKTDQEKLKQAQLLYENSDKTANEVFQIVGLGGNLFLVIWPNSGPGLHMQNNVSPDRPLLRVRPFIITSRYNY